MRKVALWLLALQLAVGPVKAQTPFTTFSFPGTGSPTSRTQPNRIGDTFNVKEYGATGANGTCGVSDDTAAVQAAIAAAEVKGGVVFFPPGEYSICSKLTTGGAGPAITFLGSGASHENAALGTTLIAAFNDFILDTSNSITVVGTVTNTSNLLTNISSFGALNEFNYNRVIGWGLPTVANGAGGRYDVFAPAPLTPAGTALRPVGTTASTSTSSAVLTFSGTTNATTTATTSTSSNILTFGGGVPAGVRLGSVVTDSTTPSAISTDTFVAAIGATTVTMSANAAATVGSGDTIAFTAATPYRTINSSPVIQVVAGMQVADATNPSAITAGTYVLSTTSTSVTISANAAATIANGDSITFSALNPTRGTIVLTDAATTTMNNVGFTIPPNSLNVGNVADIKGIAFVNNGVAGGGVGSGVFASFHIGFTIRDSYFALAGFGVVAADQLSATVYNSNFSGGGLTGSVAIQGGLSAISPRITGWDTGIQWTNGDFGTYALNPSIEVTNTCVFMHGNAQVLMGMQTEDCYFAGVDIACSGCVISGNGISGPDANTKTYGLYIQGGNGVYIAGNVVSVGNVTTACAAGNVVGVNVVIIGNNCSSSLGSAHNWSVPTSYASANADVHFIGNNTPSNLGVIYNNLPVAGSGNAGSQLLVGDNYQITDAATGNCSDSACNWGANVTGGGGSLFRKLEWNGTNWTVVGK